MPQIEIRLKYWERNDSGGRSMEILAAKTYPYLLLKSLSELLMVDVDVMLEALRKIGLQDDAAAKGFNAIKWVLV